MQSNLHPKSSLTRRDWKNISGRIDLSDPGGLALLRRLDLQWGRFDAARRAATLSALDLVVPVPADGEAGVVLLPGGSLALRQPAGGLLVCDPLEATTFDADAAARLRGTLGRHSASLTALHTAQGPGLMIGLPAMLPTQAATLAAAGALEAETGWDGPAFVQWHSGGAVGWPLAPAPALISLVAGLAGQKLAPGWAGPTGEIWQADTIDGVFVLISPAVAEHVDNLLAPELSDALRHALTGFCADGSACLASQAAEAVCVLPAFLFPGHVRRPGAPVGPDWAAVRPLLADPHAPQVLLGLTGASGDPVRTAGALRTVLAGLPARIVLPERETGPLVDVHTDAALFALREVGTRAPVCVVLPPPADGAVGLYGLARDVGRLTGAQVVASAPCWGFLHRLEPDGLGEGGNAAWFGMGPGLDELDLICSEDF